MNTLAILDWIKTDHERTPDQVDTHDNQDGLPLHLIDRHGKAKPNRKLLPLESEREHVVVAGWWSIQWRTPPYRCDVLARFMCRCVHLETRTISLVSSHGPSTRSPSGITWQFIFNLSTCEGSPLRVNEFRNSSTILVLHTIKVVVDYLFTRKRFIMHIFIFSIVTLL